MFENENNGLFGGIGELDLGSDLGMGFDTFPAFDGSTDVFASTYAPENAEVKETTVSEEKASEEKKNEPIPVEASNQPLQTDNPGSVPNLFDAAIAKAESKQAEDAKSALVSKLPVFSYANATEDIVDTSKTFDQLRIEKAEDFPELDDYEAVKWKMVYGTITKAIPTPKKTTIASLKTQIEESREFLESLKKAKGEITCKVTPSVTAKKKGIMSSQYKGVFTSVREARESGKTISYIPSDNGRVYEMRTNKIGAFIAEADNVSALAKVRAGFIPALPKIPYDMLSEILMFFKTYALLSGEVEALANIYWSVDEEKYFVHVPKQEVSKANVNTTLPELDEDKFVLVMELHSHNTMPAVFSRTDDRDERATRIYTVVGRLDKVFPDILTRISVGGKYVTIPPETVFDGIAGTYPAEWNDAVSIKRRRQQTDETC